MEEQEYGFRHYRTLALATGFGSMMGSGIIVGLSATLAVWQTGLNLTNFQVGLISGILTFSVAFGSIFGGRVATSIGLVKTYNFISLIYAIGVAVCVFSTNFIMLLIGAIIAGISSGTDLPVGLAVISHDAPNDNVSAELISSTQIFWGVGICISYLSSFVVSTMGILGARIVFIILFIIAVVTWLWRSLSAQFKVFHAEADKRLALKSSNEGKVSTNSTKVSITKIIFSDKKYVLFVGLITVYYVLWNLVANTWGQFQTFMLVKANASQTLATGVGIVLTIIALTFTTLFATISGTKYRNKAYTVGSVVMFLALVSMTILGSNVWAIIVALAFYNFSSSLAGEAIFKIWTVESIPSAARSSILGLINGFSRLICALFAFVTPALVMPGVIRKTMLAFSIILFIAFACGHVVIRLQKKYGIEKN